MGKSMDVVMVNYGMKENMYMIYFGQEKNMIKKET